MYQTKKQTFYKTLDCGLLFYYYNNYNTAAAAVTTATPTATPTTTVIPEHSKYRMISAAAAAGPPRATDAELAGKVDLVHTMKIYCPLQDSVGVPFNIFPE